MARTLGYLLTWTTYGTWLQGDERGYVKDGEVLGANVAIKIDCRKNLKGGPVRLVRNERAVVREAILGAREKFDQKILAIAVCSNHVHVVCEYVDVPIGVVVSYYKNAGRTALKRMGFQGRLWTGGYDKRFCLNEAALAERIRYVRGHD
jgi:hypothetical protein